MSERILLLLMELFAIAGRGNPEDEAARKRMEEDFLRSTLSSEKAEEFSAFYDRCIDAYHGSEEDGKDQHEKRSSRISAIGVDLNEALTQKQKLIVMARLIEYVFVASQVAESEIAFLNSIYITLKVPEAEYKLLFDLVSNPTAFKGSNALIIASNYSPEADTLYKQHPKMDGVLRVAQLSSAKMYFAAYSGNQSLQLNGVPIQQHVLQIFGPGAIIRGEAIEPIYYADVEQAFAQEISTQQLAFKADKITFHFAGGKVGLHALSFTETSGRLIGIMGGSGAGKSTLLNVLNGNAPPSSGSVTVNGIDIHKEPQKLEGVIGFVSQSDLLIEDLSVYQNLYFNAQLCLNEASDAAIQARVDNVLRELGLFEAKDLKVGNPLEKTISGGQRKRLNIALELIREPAVLFLDEPTSGLSSSDSEIILDLLKSLALKGKLIFVVIHQPSSQIFKLFDNLLLLDKGGYPVYQGNPVDAITYFKTATHRINPDISQCVCCGNVNPEQIFTIIEARVLDENGFPTGERRFSPVYWNKYYNEHTDTTATDQELPNDIEITHSKPGFWRQLGVFIKRDVLSKLNNRQYMAITLLEAPVLAILLGTLTKYVQPESVYSFQDNINIVPYIFMSVIVMLFLGLMTSAEEILRDRKIRQRERFLNLSNLAYLKSKVLILMTISALQAFLFVFIGNHLLGFQELYFEYWLMLFMISVFANALGLNISSAFKSAVTIYILIPFLIIPQLILSGLLVKFDELHPTMATRSVVPWVGELMATRWAFEGLAVVQFKENSYAKPLYELEGEKARLLYLSTFWCDEMSKVATSANSSQNADSVAQVLQNAFLKVGISQKHAGLSELKSGKTERIIKTLRKQFRKQSDHVNWQLDSVINAYKSANGEDYWQLMQAKYSNLRLSDLVLGKDGVRPGIYFENGAYHSGKYNAYFNADPERQIRSHFFAPKKHLFGRYYETYWVNLLVLVCMTVVLYITLYYDLLRKLVGKL